MAILFKTIESKESLGFVASILETKITAINFATSKLCAFIMLPPELSRLQKNSEKNQDQINKLELYNQAAVYLDNKIATNQKVKAEKEYWQELLVQAIAQDAKDLGYREWELENWYSIWQTQRNVAHLNSDSLLNLYQIVQQLDLEYLNLYKQILFFYGLLPHKRRELVKSIKINIKSLYVLQQEILSSMLLRIRAAEFLHDLDFDDLYCFSKVFAHYVMYHEPIDKNYLRQKSRGDAFLGLNNLTIFVQTILEKGNKKQKEELFKIKWLQSGVENVLPVNNHANYVVPTNFAYYLAEDSKFLRKKRFFVSSIKTIIAVNSASEKLSSLEEMLHNRISLACLSVTPEFNSAIMLAQALLEEEEHINQNRPLAIFRFLPFFEQYKIHKLLDAYHGFLRKFAAKYLDGATEVVDHIMLYVEDEIISSLKNCNAQYANLFPSKAVQKIRLFVQLFGDEIRYAALQKMIEPANLFIKLDALEELRKHKVVMSDVSSLVSLSIFVKRNYSLPESIAINKIINLIVKHDYPKDEKADKSLLKYLQLLFRECKYKEVVANNFLQEEILAKYVYYSDCANEDAYNFLQRCSPLLMAKWKELRSISLVQQFMFINKLLQMKSGNEVNIYAKYGYNNLSLSLYKLVSYIEGLQQSDIKFKTNYILLLLGQAKEYVTYNYIGSNNIYAQLLLTLCYKNRNGHDILGAYCAKRLDFCYTNHVQVSSKDVKFFGQVKRIEAIHAVCLEQTQLLYSGSDVNFYLAMKEIGSQRLMAVYLNKRSEYILQHNIMIDKLELAAFRIHMDYKIVESALTKTFTQYFIGGQENCLKLLALFLDKEFVSMLYQKRIVKIINKELNLSNEDLDFIIVHYDNDFVMEMLRISLEQNYLGEYSQDIISIAEATNQDVRIEFAIQKLLFLVDNLDAILHGDEEALLFKAYTALNTEFKLFAHELLDDLYLEEKNKNNVAYLESNMFNYLIENFTLNKVQEEYRIFRLSRLFDLNNVILTKQYLNLLKTFNLDLDRLIVNEQNINKLSTIVSGYLKKMDRNGTFEGNGVILIEALQMNLNFYAYGELSFLWLKNYVTNPNLYMTARTKLQAIDLECHLSNLSFVFEDKEDSIDNIAKLFGVNGLALLREFLTQELPLVTFDTHQDVINVYSRLLKSVYLDNFVDRNEHAYNLILISKIICIKDNLEVGYIEAAAQDAKEVANEYIKAKNQAGEQEDQAIA